jgi:HSP20 family molecular chaperone IbpA
MNARDPRNWMWAQALEMLDEADRLHRQFFQPGTPASLAWQPPVDVVETGNEYWILVALPGVSPARTRVVFDGAALVVSGERPLPAECHAGAIRRLEIPYGHFERQIPLPSGRHEITAQRFEHGCLVIGLRRLV